MATARTLEVEGSDGARVVRLTSPDRVLYPDSGITKSDLADYTIAVGSALVARLADRPVTLERFPTGIDGEAFYSKNPPKGAPEWARTVMVTYPSGRRHPQLVIDELATALWAVQMNTITFHPWTVRTDDVDRPDELRIDLDPQPGRDYADAVTAALALRDLLTEVGLTGWVKTSGHRGVHVFAPIEPTHEFLDVRHAVIGIARELEARLPDLVTTAWWKEERGERVFVDFNQAARDRTIASAYSPRPLPGAPISMPLRWEQLPGSRTQDYTLRTVPVILERDGDAWASMGETRGTLGPALDLWEAQVAAGRGELNFPPDYPKMPGEPPRVPPSKRRADKDDADYLTPKADRDEAERRRWNLPVIPPVPPMLAKPVASLDALGDREVILEPKWDGFRAIIFRSGDEVEIGSRNEKPLTRYFPELVEAARAELPPRCVVDGEIIVVRPGSDRLDFDLLSQRIHPAKSRVTKLSEETPAQFVAFDLLALDDDDLRERPFGQRREALVGALSAAGRSVHLTPATTDRGTGRAWFEQFEGAGLDGLIAKPVDGVYESGKRSQLKIKHVRTADCVVAGYRVHSSGPDAVGSLMLGLYAEDGVLRSVGVIGALPMATRRALMVELAPLVTDFEDHPWNWAATQAGERTPQAAGGSRWAAGKDLSFVPLRPERVVEVRYDHMEGERFRHTAQFVRWRTDKDPHSCTYEQLEEPVSYDLSAVLGGGGGA